MKYFKEIEIDINTKELLSTVFQEEPAFVIDWIREHAEEILEYKNFTEKVLTDFIQSINPRNDE
jgi:hypothetical protein